MMSKHNSKEMAQRQREKEEEEAIKESIAIKEHQMRMREKIGKLSGALNEDKQNRKTVKDKERAKRMKGQSSHHSWKSETFMLLRQQFD